MNKQIYVINNIKLYKFVDLQLKWAWDKSLKYIDISNESPPSNEVMLLSMQHSSLFWMDSEWIGKYENNCRKRDFKPRAKCKNCRIQFDITFAKPHDVNKINIY